MADLAAPPCDPVFAGYIGKPQPEITTACERRTQADEVVPAQLVERAQQMVLIAQPALLFCDDGRTVAVGAYPELINPFGAASDVDVPNRTPDLRLFRMGDK